MSATRPRRSRSLLACCVPAALWPASTSSCRPNLWRMAWWSYTRLILPVAGLALGGRAWWDVGRFLGPNISGHYHRWPLPRLLEAWDAAGMIGVEYRVMSLGGGIVMWGTK